MIVFLHGVGLGADAWAPIIDALTPRFRVVAPDMAGHGPEPGQERPGTLREYAEATLPWLDEPALLVGHSMGAMIALDLASRIAERVLGVIALNAIFERDPDAQKAVQGRAAALDGVSVADPEATLNRWFGVKDTAARQACAHWLRSVDPGGYKAAYSIFASENGPSRGTLGRMRQPALFMTGADDPNSTPSMSTQMAALAENGEAVIVERAAHMMPMTHAEAVAEAIETFWTTEVADVG